MKYEELKNVTYNDLKNLTYQQLQLEKFELLKLASTGEIKMPYNTQQKLYELCQQAIDDYNKVSPSHPIAFPADHPTPQREKLSIAETIGVISGIFGIIGVVFQLFSPVTPLPVDVAVPVNISMTIEEKEMLRLDIEQIINEIILLK